MTISPRRHSLFPLWPRPSASRRHSSTRRPQAERQCSVGGGGPRSWPSLEETQRASTQHLVDEHAALYKNQMEGSTEEFCQADVLSRIEELLRAKPNHLSHLGLPRTNYSTWIWWIYYGSLSEKSALATGRCTLTLCQKCCAIWQLLGTIPTPNQPTSVCIG